MKMKTPVGVYVSNEYMLALYFFGGDEVFVELLYDIVMYWDETSSVLCTTSTYVYAYADEFNRLYSLGYVVSTRQYIHVYILVCSRHVYCIWSV